MGEGLPARPSGGEAKPPLSCEGKLPHVVSVKGKGTTEIVSGMFHGDEQQVTTVRKHRKWAKCNSETSGVVTLLEASLERT